MSFVFLCFDFDFTDFVFLLEVGFNSEGRVSQLMLRDFISVDGVK